MTERLLQYIWQLQLFNKTSLLTTAGETIAILQPGQFNTNQGPDFSEAKIKVGNTTWAGNIELHINASQWKQHGHSNDANYNNVILHVVWLNDVNDEMPFPTLELQPIVSSLLLGRYEEMMNEHQFIPCENIIQQADELTWVAWKERLLVERLQKKAQIIFNYLRENNQHWEETFWWMMARNFGMPVNTEAFEKLARSIPQSIFAKNKHQLHHAEALLFGQAGFLTSEFKDDYPKMLQKEYQFYKTKYKLVANPAAFYHLRMRPSNFPEVRLAQLSMLIHQSHHLFSIVKEATDINSIRRRLAVSANDYWNYHYRFEDAPFFKEKRLGSQMIDSILINTIVPALFAYGHYNKDVQFTEKALKWMEEAAAEKNNITKGFEAIGISNKNAFDSQALLHLKQNYCDQKRCLDCSIGVKLLQRVK